MIDSSGKMDLKFLFHAGLPRARVFASERGSAERL